MAASPIIPNCVQIRLLWSSGLGVAVNVLNGQVTGSVTVNQATADTVGSGIKLAFSTILGSFYGTGTSLQKVGLRDMRTANMAEIRDSGAPVAGVGVGDPLPPSVASMVTLRTLKAGKSFRGRIYLPAMIEAENDATGSAALAASDASRAFVQQIVAVLGPAGMKLGVASRAAEQTIITKTVNHSDGTTTVKTLSNTTAKAAQINEVTALETRTAAWESQRRRGSSGGSTALLFSTRGVTVLPPS